MALLEDTPRRIAESTADISPTRLRTTPVLGVWSARDVLAHLRACSDARGDFIPKILAEKKPTLRAIDPRTLIERSGYLELEFGPSFRAYVRQRVRLVALLNALPRASWSRTAVVTGGGLARDRTVLFYAQWLARHEPAHVRHIARAFTKR